MDKKVVAGIVVVLVILIGVFLGVNRKSTPSATLTQPATSTTPSTQAGVTTHSIQISNFTFSPSTITIKAGESITWTNGDSVEHSATADNGSFDTGLLAQGQSKTITFSKPGTYKYHCSVHPNMQAQVVVQ